MHIMMTVNAAWNIWNFRRSVVAALLADGHRVTILAPPDDSVPELERMGCRVVPLAMRVKGLNPLVDLALVLRLRRMFRQQKPDAILSYTIKNNICGGLAARLTGVPFIPNVTGLGTAFLSGGMLWKLAEALYRRAFRGLPVIFFQNKDDRTLFLDRNLIHPGQARLLPGSGIDLARFSETAMPPPSQPATFLMIARLLRDKGVIEFVDAARQVKAQRPETRFQLLGAIGAENRTAINAATVQSWVDDGTIDYLGTTSDVRPAIAAATCVVLPSYREGAPRTLIEAAAMARPLIATDVPGCRAVVAPGISGFLCTPRSSESLTAAIIAFLDLPHDARVEMGRAGRRKMAHDFDEAIVVAAYRDAIAALTDRG